MDFVELGEDGFRGGGVEVGDVVAGESGGDELEGGGGERLGGVAVLAGDVGLGDGAFGDGVEGFAGFAVEDVEEAHFGGLDDAVDGFSVALKFC